MIRTVALLATIAVLLIAIGAFRSDRHLRRWLGFDPAGALRPVRAGLLGFAVLATAIAFAQVSTEPPALGGASSDVVLLVDVSRSMDATDTPPSRLRRAVRLGEHLIDEAESVRLGLVLFAGDAFPALPLTQDRDAALTYLRGLDTDLISRPGTDLARALRVASSVFDPTSSRPRVILLLTDGEHAGGDLAGAIQELRGRGVRVVAVGFGTHEGGLIPGPGADPLRDRHGQAVRSRRADPVLERIAQETGGTFLRETEDRPDPVALLPAPLPLRSDEDSRPVRIPPWVGLGLIALGIEIYLSSPRARRRFRRRRVAAVATVAVLLIAAGPWTWLREGDARLEKGEAREALSLYRRAERSRGPSPATQIRMGNALYRLGQSGPASGAYLEALRGLEPDDYEVRFLAAFNLGTVLLEQKRFREARSALWTALLAHPDSLEAKFNYEWAVDHLPPEEEPVVGSASNRGDEESEESPSPSSSIDESDRPDPTDTDLSPGEAERWLRSIREEPGEPLREQIAQRLESGGRRAPGGQTW
jgi:Ca-activated chloride channel family protein